MIFLTDEWEPWMDDLPEADAPKGCIDEFFNLLEEES